MDDWDDDVAWGMCVDCGEWGNMGDMVGGFCMECYGDYRSETDEGMDEYEGPYE